MKTAASKGGRTGTAGREKLERASVSFTDVGRFAEALRNAQRELLSGAAAVREEFALGPRGAWIIGLIATGRVKTQSDVVKRYKVGRSIIAEEMALLTENGLVICEKSEADRRHVTLALTPRGQDANRRLGDALTARIKQRLGEAYNLNDFLLCTDLLWTLGGGASGRGDPEP